MKKIIVIVGPTAVGKTDLAVWLTQHFPAAILSVDSRQCYKELNIGVGKPSAEILEKTPQYFINTHSVFQEIDAHSFEQYGKKAIDEICAAHQTPVIVGGTGLYLNSLLCGIDEMPSISMETKTAIRTQYQQKGLAWLQAKVAQEDPVYWAIVDKKNPQRLMRALEMIASTGKPFSSYRQNKSLKSGDYSTLKIGLNLPRLLLNQQIDDRVDSMIAQGLVEEAKLLHPFKNLNALQTIGYKEIFEYLENKQSLPEAIQAIKTHTHQYAKRQLTWFKKDNEIQWFQPAEQIIILEKCKAFIRQ